MDVWEQDWNGGSSTEEGMKERVRELIWGETAKINGCLRGSFEI